RKELNAITNETARYNRLVELNVQEQCVNVIKLASVQQAYNDHGYPTVHGWVFDLHNGKLIDLKLDFAHILKDIQEIYRLEKD
ncbi:MAG TPA: carbonic anhydrase, partial [Flavihumibacter sp.]|nr:carbonic anhydrase [Flavihumibacter sp.]